MTSPRDEHIFATQSLVVQIGSVMGRLDVALQGVDSVAAEMERVGVGARNVVEMRLACAEAIRRGALAQVDVESFRLLL